jgi:hypothetical protein
VPTALKHAAGLARRIQEHPSQPVPGPPLDPVALLDDPALGREDLVRQLAAGRRRPAPARMAPSHSCHALSLRKRGRQTS